MLDRAWFDAEAAIPDELDWGGPMLYRFSTVPGAPKGPYGAKASPPGDAGLFGIYGYGPTPTQALLDLIEKLREWKETHA